jgi:hypothetical protein
MSIQRLFYLIIIYLNLSLVSAQTNIAPVFKDGYWSLIDTSLQVLFPYKYNDIKIAGNNTAIARVGNQYFILKINPQKEIKLDYKEVNFFNDKYFLIKSEGLKGLIDLDGNEVIPAKFSDIEIYRNQIIILKSGNKVQYFYPKDQTISEPFDKFEYITASLYQFYKGGQFLIYDAATNNSSIYFSTLNEVNYPLIYCTANENSKFVVQCDNGFKYFETDFFYFDNSEPRFTIYRLLKAYQMYDSRTGKRFKVDYQKIEKRRIYEISNAFEELFAEKNKEFYAFVNEGKWGLMDTTFKLLIKPEYENILLNDEGIALRNEGKIGLADRVGKILVPVKYDNYIKADNYWIVINEGKCGVVNQSGNEVVGVIYNELSLAFSNKFIVKKGEKFGLIDENNNQLIAIRYDDIYAEGNYLFLKLNQKSGVANQSGNIIIPPKFDEIRLLNNSYFSITSQNKKSIIDTKGNQLFPPRFKEIDATDNPEIFKVSSFELINLTYIDLRNEYGIEIEDSESKFNTKRYKTGIINASGQILLDPEYDEYQIDLDTEGNTIIVKEKQGVIIVNFNNQGKLIDKTRFKNYISVKKEIKNEPKKEYNDSLPFYWKQTPASEPIRKYALFHISGRKAIDYYFKEVGRSGFNPVLNITRGPDNLLGIVSRKTGKVMLSDVYKEFAVGDFKNRPFARCYRASGGIILIDTLARIVDKGISYMDELNLSYIRVNKGGKFSKKSKNPHQIYIYSNHQNGIKRIIPAESANSVLNGGKWGVVDSLGHYLINPKYSFLQIYFNEVFIAELNGKWGVINVQDSVIIDFKYDEIQFFKDTSINSWSNAPYYKVRIKDKWGAIDSVGNIIVDVEFTDVELIYTFGKYFFKTHVDYANTPYGIIRQNGKLLIGPQFSIIEPFADGYARVEVARGSWKFIDTSGRVFPEEGFRNLRDFSDGLAAVRFRTGWGFIDINGKEPFPEKYSEVGDFHEGFSKVKIQLKSKYGGLVKPRQVYAIIDKQGKMVFNTKSRACSDVSRGLVIVENKKKSSLKSLDGKKVIPGSFLQIVSFSKYGLYLVKNKSKQYALYNSQGKQLIPFGKYKDYDNFSEGLCYVKGSESGFIDTLGNLKFKFVCEKTKGFAEGFAAVKKDSYWGFIDTTGHFVIPAEYSNVENFVNGFASITDSQFKSFIIDKKNEKYKPDLAFRTYGYNVFTENGLNGIKNEDRLVVICPVSKSIGSFSNGFATINIPRLYGLYDGKGKMLYKSEIPVISLDSNKLIKLMTTNQVIYIK